MKRSFIDSRLYLEGLKQLRPLGITAGILILISCAVPVLLYASRLGFTDETFLSSVDYGFFTYVAPSLFALVFIVSTALVHRAFSFLNHRNASDFYHSLPMSRTCICASLSAGVLTWVFGIAFISLSCVWIISASYGWVLNPLLIPCLLASTLAASLFTVSAALIAVSATGTRVAGLIANGLALFLPFCILWLIGHAVSVNSPVASPKELGFIFDPALNIPAGVIYNAFGMSGGYFLSRVSGIFLYPEAILCTAAEGALYLCAGWLLFVRRKSETADRAASGKASQHILRCALALPFLFGAFIFMVCNLNEPYRYSGMPAIMGILATAAAIFYFGFELIAMREGKKLVQAIPAFLITAAIAAALAFSSLLISGAARETEPKPEDVAYVRMTPSADPSYAGEKAYTIDTVGRQKFTDPEMIRKVLEGLKDTLPYYRTGIYIFQSNLETDFVIGLKDGRTLYRKLQQAAMNMNDLVMLPGFRESHREALLRFPSDAQIYGMDIDGIDLPEETEKKIWETFKEEAKGLNWAQLARVTNDFPLSMYGDESVPEVDILSFTSYSKGYGSDANIGNIDIRGTMGAGSFYADYAVTVLTPRTAQLLTDAVRSLSIQSYTKKTESVLNATPEANYVYSVTLYNIQVKGSAQKQNYEFRGQIPLYPEELDGGELFDYENIQIGMEFDKKLFKLLRSCGTEQPDVSKPFAKIKINDNNSYGGGEKAPMLIALPAEKIGALMALYAEYEAVPNRY